MRGLACALAAAVVAACLPGHAWSEGETTLILATALPPGNPLAAQVLHPWAERVNRAGAGILKIDVRDGMAIADLNNSYDRVVANVVQISWLTYAHFAGKFRLSNVGGLPFVANRSEDASVAMWRLYQSGLLAPEYDQVRPIMMSVLSQSGFHFRSAPASLEDLRGLKVIAASRQTGQLAERLGMAPIVLVVSETYQALQRGTVDGVMMGWTAVQSFNLQEVTSYHVDASLGTAVGMMFIGKKRYDTLPPEARKLIDEFSGEKESGILGRFWDRIDALGHDRVKAMPRQTVIDPPPALVAKWRAKAEPVVEGWARATPGGEKVLAAFRAALAQVGSGR
jgi:TRAP-type transport system periplasmic protein